MPATVAWLNNRQVRIDTLTRPVSDAQVVYLLFVDVEALTLLARHVVVHRATRRPVNRGSTPALRHDAYTGRPCAPQTAPTWPQRS